MTRILFSMLAAVMLLISPARAQDNPVVVELYTSQGCSSCPPADAYLHKLVARSDVIALALHVDYWDYIGWKDVFGNKAWSDRQRGYAKTGGRRMVYTPQMIINGRDHVVGNRPRDVEELIDKHSRATHPVAVSATREGNRLTVTAQSAGRVNGAFEVVLVRFKPKELVEIKRGENAGKTLSYANIVTRIDPLKSWTGRAPLTIEAKMTGDQAGVVLIQESGHGAVVAAARVN